MTAWIAVIISALVAAGAAARAIWLGGRRDGKIDTVLERLTDGHLDHEGRIRYLEDPRRRHR